MGLYIRKSVRVGPLRFNLSTSGIGVSTGIPGFRLGIGPRGTQIHLGRGGFYYRQTISHRASQKMNSHARPETMQPDRVWTHGPMAHLDLGNVADMVDTNSSDLLHEIKQKRARFVFWPVGLAAILVIVATYCTGSLAQSLVLPSIILLSVATIVMHEWDQLRKSVVLMYDLDKDSMLAYENLCTAFDDLRSCSAVWQVTSHGQVYDPKYQAGANHLINRKSISLTYCDPPFIKTNLLVPSLTLGNRSWYLLPDRALIYASNDVGAVDYEAIEFTTSHSDFVEDGAVPADAMILKYTWKFVNKNGRRDHRFNDNKEIPVCRYELLHLSVPSGVQELLQISQMGIASRVQSAVSEVVQEIFTAKVAEKVRLIEEERRRNQELAERATNSSKLITDEAAKDSSSPVESDDVYTALFELCCTIMISDGRASTSEKETIRDVMRRVNSKWPDDELDRRIVLFIDDVRSLGYSSVLSRSMSRLPLFKGKGRDKVLLKSIDLVAKADGAIAKREIELCDRIRKFMDNGDS